MPTWSEILSELNKLRTQGPKSCDIVRRKYLKELHDYTNRNTILYATQWTQPGADPNLITITDEDLQGFMEVVHGLDGKRLDIILHSPGGSAEAAEAIVIYLRQRFSQIRVIIPHAAMSAATMLACASNKIIMGEHSFIGPIDPQMLILNQFGRREAVPAQTILDQFQKAQQDCQNPQMLGSWAPILPQYGPARLIQCQNAISLSKNLVSQWLGSFMFSRRRDPYTIANSIADFLSDHSYFKTHSRHISRHVAKNKGLNVGSLENDQKFQDLVLSVFHATTHTFGGTPAVKIIENHNGKAFIKHQAIIKQN